MKTMVACALTSLLFALCAGCAVETVSPADALLAPPDTESEVAIDSNAGGEDQVLAALAEATMIAVPGPETDQAIAAAWAESPAWQVEP